MSQITCRTRAVNVTVTPRSDTDELTGPHCRAVGAVLHSHVFQPVYVIVFFESPTGNECN
ncbi:MAG: hypothetical protein QM713_15905 [Arachnia sp.]